MRSNVTTVASCKLSCELTSLLIFCVEIKTFQHDLWQQDSIFTKNVLHSSSVWILSCTNASNRNPAVQNLRHQDRPGRRRDSVHHFLSSHLLELLFLPSLKLLRFAFYRLDEQRQIRVHRFLRGSLDRRSVWVIFTFRSCRFLFTSSGALRPPLLLLPSAALLLCQDALRGLRLLVAGVRRVQVEQVGGEHGLETRVFDVDLDTQTAERSTH